jgi:hypothetical protein
MKYLIISHPVLRWRVTIQFDTLKIGQMLKECFSEFCLKDDKICSSVPSSRILKVQCTGTGYRIDGIDQELCDLESVIGLLMELISGSFFLTSDVYTFLHGAALEKQGRCHLFIAPTMTGKTTTTAILCTKGYGYFSDDVIAVHNQSLQVVSFPRVMCIRNEKLLADYDMKWERCFKRLSFQVKSPEQYADGFETRACYIPNNTYSVCGSGLNIERIVFLERNQSCMDSIYKKINGFQSFPLLSKNMRDYRQYKTNKSVLMHLIKAVPMYLLTYSDGYTYLSDIEI